MWITNYPELISESGAELHDQERRLRGSPLESRVMMLRLLKNGTYRSQRQLAEVLGYSRRQVGRWWQTYQQGGLDALLVIGKPTGKPERMTDEALAALDAAMQQGEIATLEQARTFLAEHYSIHYRGVSGLSRLFKRHQSKRKTGRRRHRQASEHEQTVFQK